jgi:hypothetical protein
MKNIFKILTICICFKSLGQIKSDSVKSDSVKLDSVAIETKTAWILSSNFTVPSVQYQPYITNFIDKNGNSTNGAISFFNSIGAGISVSKASFKQIISKTDTSGFDIQNKVGIQFGFLFSRTSGQTTEISRFALHTGISLMDFQLGYGYEFGTINKDLKKGFFTISYGIPMSKFTKKTAHVFKNNNGMNKRLSKINNGYSI